MRRRLLPVALGLACLGVLIGATGLLRGPWQELDGARAREALVPAAAADPAQRALAWTFADGSTGEAGFSA